MASHDLASVAPVSFGGSSPVFAPVEIENGDRFPLVVANLPPSTIARQSMDEPRLASTVDPSPTDGSL
jgi:hypothetical protein